MIDQVANKEIISLWIGKQSQKCATSFYNLQAEQIFSEQEDPLLHSSLWKDAKKLQPRMIIFDTQIDRLAAVREVNNKKILQKMQKKQGWSSLMGVFGNIDTTPLKKAEENTEVNEWPQHSNWTDKESNYFLIDQGYTSIPSNPKESPDLQLKRFHIYEEFYRINRDECENRLRKQLQKTDFLKVFSICTDQTYSGYTAKMIENLREECPKKVYTLASISASNELPIVSLSKIYDQVDILLPINTNAVKFPYFKDSTLSKNLAPFFSTLLTPFCLKQVDPYFYISTIISDNRKLFNAAFTLPIIDLQSNLSKSTNLFRFEEAAIKMSKNKDKDKRMTTSELLQKFEKVQKKGAKEKEEEQEEEDIRVNFTNQSYLSLSDCKNKGRFLSQSYILKGHYKDFEKTFQPKSQPSSLSIKYLQGIFSACDESASFYDKFYEPEYGQRVQAYPYHLNMFSHENFGESLRKHLNLTKKVKLFNEQWPECRQKIMHIADSYLELHQESD